MQSFNIFKILLLCTIGFGMMQCTDSEAQRNFEEQALRPPSGIRAMTVNGSRVEDGEDDPDDWRIALEFRGTVSIETAAFPNPVPFNSSLEILVRVNSFQAVNGLQVFAFQQSDQMIGPLFQRGGSLDTGFITIRLNPGQFASSTGTGNFGNIYRIIFYDARFNIISYGDVQVE